MSRSTFLLVASLIVALWLAPVAVAQTSFTEVTPTTGALWVTNADEDFWINAVAPADVDGDGDLDLAVLGFYVVYYGEVTDLLVIFKNQGSDESGHWTFAEETVPLGSMWAGASDLAWGDYDNDGDPDLVVGSEGSMALYRNDAGTLVATNTVLPAYSEDSSYEGSYDLRSITWADADNDGDLDLLVPSVFDFDTFEYATKLLRNDGPDGSGAWTFSDTVATIDPTSNAQSAWADDDGDGDLDLFLVNVDPYTGLGFVKRYRNDAGAFTGQDLLGITVEHGLADWGDYDGDGDMDVLVTGNIQETDGSYVSVLRVYRNDAGTFTETTLPAPDPGVPGAWWLEFHAATWADYDSDGDVDLLFTGSYVGESEIRGGSEVYRNTGGGFVPLGLALPAPVESIGRGGAFTWFDLDNDGDLDYLVAGAYYVPGGNGLVEAQVHLYRNGAPATNAAPTAPSSLVAAQVGGGVALSWNAATDDHTPAAAITYDLMVHAGGISVPTPQRLPEPGNISAVTGWQLTGLAPGTYTWKVRAADAAFRGGPAAQGTFTIGTITPPGVSDGRQGGAVQVAKLDPLGSALEVSWDTTTCTGAAGYHVVYGVASQLPSSSGGTFWVGGSACGVASPWTWSGSPDPSSVPGRLLWFLVIANDGARTEGSWGTDSRAIERMGPAAGGASGECGVTTKNLANSCRHFQQVMGNPDDRYMFSTSPLRNVARQPACLDNGAFARPEDTIRHAWTFSSPRTTAIPRARSRSPWAPPRRRTRVPPGMARIGSWSSRAWTLVGPATT